MKILTFDVEEWFHILDHDGTKSEKQWRNFEYRLDSNMDKVLDLLDRNNQKATFFCLGWLAKDYTHIIKRLDSLGYEIATHSNLHQLVYEQKVSAFESDLEKSVKSLEDITGKKIRAYRAPGFSIKEENRWVFDILLSYGIEIDCSVFPARRAHGGFHKYKAKEPSIIRANNGDLKEFPMSMSRIGLQNIVYTGGGYFRFFPYSMIRFLMSKSSYTMTYFHPHDFDSSRPIVGSLSHFNKFKSKVGLNNSLRKMEKMIQEFHFIDLDEAVKRVDWDNVKVISLPERRNIQRLDEI
jgi:polysaccharide deacetylase family protein (PEP-CTERM system associated)